MKRRAIILLFLAFGAVFAVIAFATRREPERFLCGHQDPSLSRAPNSPQPCPITVIKKIASTAILVLPALLAGYLLGQIHGRRAAQITEFKQYSGNMLTLTHWETNHPPELKDFVKAHYYRLANQIPEDWVGIPSNYGPVSTNISPLTAFKGPSNAQSEYQDFLRRFPNAQLR